MYCAHVECYHLTPCSIHKYLLPRPLSLSIQSFSPTLLHRTKAPTSPSTQEFSSQFEPEISFCSPLHNKSFPPHHSDYITLHGCIEGANWGLSEPRQWNGSVLIFCHGYRPPGYGKVVELKDDDLCYAKLLSHGWIVATTSYRREGVILCDAITDILNLRQFIVDRYGVPRHVVLEGQSMGGMIATLIAENYSQHFSGILAVGAALQTRKDKMSEEEKQLPLRHCPHLPILYLTNDSETGPIEQYIRGVQQCIERLRGRVSGGGTSHDSKSSSSVCRSGSGSGDSSSNSSSCSVNGTGSSVPTMSLPVHVDDEDVETIILPALWEVSRAGHNWTKGQERYGALCDLMEWIKFGTFITRRRTNYTIATPPPDCSIRFEFSPLNKLQAGTGKVIALSPTRMGLTCDFTEADLQRLGYRLGSKISVRVRNFSLQATLDEYPFLRCNRGDFMLIYEPEYTFCVLTRNNPVDHHDLLAELGRVQVGDEVVIPAF